MIQQGKIHKAIKRLPKNYEDLENMLTPNISTGTLLIIDDALGELSTGNYLPEVFEELTHRTNTALVFVSQATFLNSPTFRRLSGNFFKKKEKNFMSKYCNYLQTTRITSFASEIREML